MSENVFRILEIEPTTDKKEIKRAYARLVKRYHPEEFPEEWEKIHGAYEQALKMAEYGKPPMSAEPPEPSMQMEAPKLPVREEEPEVEPPVQEEEPETEPPELIDEEKVPEKSDEMEALFDNIGEMARERQQNPEDYAEKKIYEAYAGKSEAGSRSGSRTTSRKTGKAVWIILIIVSIIVRSGIKNAMIAREMSELQTIPRTVIENTIANSTRENVGNDTGENTIAASTAENADNDTVENTITNIAPVTERAGNVMRTHIPMVFDMIQIGDTGETMIEALGEPDEIRESQEDPDYEEAVYSSFGFGDGMFIVLQNDVITDIYIEYAMEDAAFDTYGN